MLLYKRCVKPSANPLDGSQMRNGGLCKPPRTAGKDESHVVDRALQNWNVSLITHTHVSNYIKYKVKSISFDIKMTTSIIILEESMSDDHDR